MAMSTNRIGLKIYPLIAGSSEEDLSLTKLSECLEYTLNRSLEKSKNLIIVYPENSLRPATYLAFLFMRKYRKDAILFTADRGERSENPYRNHLKRFCLLQEIGSPGFIWHSYLPCLLKDSALNIEIIFRKGLKSFDKANFKKELKLKNERLHYNKLIFSTTMLNVNTFNNIKNLVFDGEDYRSNNAIGLCIFENLSNQILTENDLNNFIEWLNLFQKKQV